MSQAYSTNAEVQRHRLHKAGRRTTAPKKGGPERDRRVPFYWLKWFLTKVGARISGRTVHNLNAITNYLEAGRWLREHGLEPRYRSRNREQLFDFLARSIADRPVLYMEFGVYRGHSLRYWSRLLLNPSSHLHGFDSFEGLPEDWTLIFSKGYLTTDGELPQIHDPRVKLFKGWFQDTLPHYVAPRHDILVINIDSDIYSSAVYVLNFLADLIVPGTYLYFDEFADQQHELRAFDEFLRQKGMRFETVGATRTLAEIVFRRIA